MRSLIALLTLGLFAAGAQAMVSPNRAEVKNYSQVGRLADSDAAYGYEDEGYGYEEDGYGYEEDGYGYGYEDEGYGEDNT